MRLNKNGKILIASLLALILLVGLIIFLCVKDDLQTPIDPTDPTITNPTLPDFEYSILSTKSWANRTWMGGIDPNLVKEIRFVPKKSISAERAWGFDGIEFYLDQNGVLEIIVFKGLKITGSMSGTFLDMANLVSISGLELVDTSEVTDMSNLFRSCTSLNNIDINQLETGNALLTSGMFYDCMAFESMDLSEMDFKNVVDASYMFAGCESLNVLKLPKLDQALSLSHLFERVGQKSDYCADIQGELNTSKCEDMSYMFQESRLYNMDMAENLDTSSLKNAEGMFYNCGLDKIDLSKWNTSNITNMKKMFYSNMWLDVCNTDGWDLSSLTSCELMFYKCTSLNDLTLNWKNVDKLKNAAGMFKYCFNLEWVDMSCMSGLQLNDASEMFSECEFLHTIYCDGLTAETSHLMFYYCFKLKGSVEFSDLQIEADMANTDGYFTKGNQ
jgi:surface protein